ncbi:MAG TPA: hypothetical protein VG842_10130 [Sediminibacterium sp.]|nr:hypothetical protein [Sediminibacterium sp.]
MMKWYLVMLVSAACMACQNKKKEEQLPAAADTAYVSTGSPLMDSFRLVMQGYYALCGDFVQKADTSLLHTQAVSLSRRIDSLPLKELKSDSMVISTARSYVDGISAELMGLIGETTLLGKKRSLQMVSDQLYDLVRTIRYTGEKIYYWYCPGSFDDQGAGWLSRTRTAAANPYLDQGQCGEIKDSVDFRPVHPAK